MTRVKTPRILAVNMPSPDDFMAGGAPEKTACDREWYENIQCK